MNDSNIQNHFILSDLFQSPKVIWFHKEKHVPLALQDSVIISKKGRIRVSNHAQSSFYLHIREVQEDDKGEYMCQVNTSPMLSQAAFLHIVGMCEKISSSKS